MRRRALEREDRLLLVADRKDGALEEAARARSSGKFRRQVPHDRPLLFARVLRLIDQHVI